MRIEGDQKSPKPAPPKPWLSGFCGKDNPPESHAQCKGRRDDGTPCRCGHHAAERLLAHAHQIRSDADWILTVDLDGIDVESGARIAHELLMARKAISAAEEFVAKHVAEQWDGKWSDTLTVDGVGQVGPYRTRNTTWDHDDAVRDLVTARMEKAGGEMPDPMDVVRWVLSLVHVDYLRVGQLKEQGLDADEYRHTTYGTVRLRIKSDDMVGGTSREEASA
jgi:hypothetical protein